CASAWKAQAPPSRRFAGSAICWTFMPNKSRPSSPHKPSSSRWFSRRSLAWHLIIRLIPAVILLALVDTAVSYVLTHNLNTQSHDRVLVGTLLVLARQAEAVEGDVRLVKVFILLRFVYADPDERLVVRFRL